MRRFSKGGRLAVSLSWGAALSESHLQKRFCSLYRKHRARTYFLNLACCHFTKVLRRLDALSVLPVALTKSWTNDRTFLAFVLKRQSLRGESESSRKHATQPINGMNAVIVVTWFQLINTACINRGNPTPSLYRETGDWLFGRPECSDPEPVGPLPLRRSNDIRDAISHSWFQP